jgi:hypothetical protein
MSSTSSSHGKRKRSHDLSVDSWGCTSSANQRAQLWSPPGFGSGTGVNSFIVNVNVNRVSNVWQPNERRASRPLRSNGEVRVLRDGSVRRSPNSPTRVATNPPQRTIGGVANRNLPQQRTPPQANAQRRITGQNNIDATARALRNSAANSSTNAPQARTASPPPRAIQPRTAAGAPERAVAPQGNAATPRQRTLGGIATRSSPPRTTAPPAATPRAEANRGNGNGAARPLRVAPAPANPPQRSPANNAARFAAPPAARSGAAPRPQAPAQRPAQRESRQATRR